MPLIRYVTPYATDKNLARAYNEEIKRGKPGEYICFTDRDTMWLDPFYGKHIESIIEEHGKAYYTCYTNRTNASWQRFGFLDANLQKHVIQAKAMKVISENTVSDHTDDQLWSGHCMIVPVDKWIPLEEKEGLLGIDNQIHLNARKLGMRVLLMEGVYIYHYYSGYDGERGNKERDKSHLI